MTDRSIIFSGEMVRALLAGRKTQTRRALKPQPSFPKVEAGFRAKEHRHGWDWVKNGAEPWPLKRIDLPFAAGDRLWVQEGWKPGAWRASGAVAIDYRASPEETHTPWCPYNASLAEMEKWAEEAIAGGAQDTGMGDLVWPAGKSPLRWRPSIHMPRWASRLTLTVTDVRVQRVRKISPRDVLCEGVDVPEHHRGELHDPHRWAPDHFRPLWDSLNAKRGYGWDANPWVAALTFTVEQRNRPG